MIGSIILWIGLDRLVIVGDGAVVVALFHVSVTPVAVGFEIFRIEPDRLTVVGNRSVVVAFFAVSDAPVGVAAALPRRSQRSGRISKAIKG
jgi:hypothetical protein